MDTETVLNTVRFDRKECGIPHMYWQYNIDRDTWLMALRAATIDGEASIGLTVDGWVKGERHQPLGELFEITSEAAEGYDGQFGFFDQVCRAIPEKHWPQNKEVKALKDEVKSLKSQLEFAKSDHLNDMRQLALSGRINMKSRADLVKRIGEINYKEEIG